MVRFRCIRSNGNARKRHETGNGNTGYPSCFQNGLTCFCHVSVYGFLQFRPVKWVPGIITAHSGPLSYEVKVAPNTVWRRHVDQLRESAVTSKFDKEQHTLRLNPVVLAATPQSASSVENEELQAPITSGMEEPWTKDTHVDNTHDNPPSSQSETMVSSPATPPCRRYPLRLRKPPERLYL